MKKTILAAWLACLLSFCLADANAAGDPTEACPLLDSVVDAANAVMSRKPSEEDAAWRDRVDAALFRVLTDTRIKTSKANCARSPVDEILMARSQPYVAGQLIEHELPPSEPIQVGYTLLTAAACFGNERVLSDTLNAVRASSGNIAVRDRDGHTAYEIFAKRLGHPQIDDSVVPCAALQEEKNVGDPKRADISPSEVLASLAPMYDPHGKELKTDEKVMTAGTAVVVVPDLATMPTKVPTYVTQLIRSPQGASLGTTTTNGAKKPQASGELRYFRNGNSDFLDPTAESLFAFVGGDVNHGNTHDKPTDPNWVATGLGFKLMRSDLLSKTPLAPFFSLDASRVNGELGAPMTYSWGELRGRAGFAENRVPLISQNFIFANVTASYYFPLWKKDWMQPTRHETGSGVPIYGAITLGGQLQHSLNDSISGVPRAFAYWRFDIYSYPLIGIRGWELFEELNLNPSHFTLTGFQETATKGGGRLWSASINWLYRPNQTLSLGRSIGNQDPTANFGTRVQRRAVTSLKLSLQN